MTFAVNKEYSKSTIQRPKNSAKTFTKLTKTTSDMNDIVVVFLLPNLDRSHTQCNASCSYLEQTFVCRVDVQLIFKNVRGNKKVYTKCKSEKKPEADSASGHRSQNGASC